MHDPLLPQDDADREGRQAELERARGVYRYDFEAMAPLALAADVPAHEKPKAGWSLMAAERMVTLAINSAKVDGDAEGSLRATHDALFELLKADRAGGMKSVLARVNTLIKEGESRGRPTSIDDYARLFREIELPAVAANYREDREFALQRLAGANPLWIRRVTQLPDHFPVTDAHYQGVMGASDSLAAAGAEGRLFLADYAILAGVACGTFPDGQKYLAAPLALFAAPALGAADRALRPVAIQCGQTPGPDAPIVVPADGLAWLLAKTRVQTADGNVHQAVSHLGHTHMPMEAFTLATHRQLSSRHPLYVLLHPHLEGTLAINESANTTLLAPQGGVDCVMAGTIEVSRALAAKGTQSWSFDGSMFPADLASRGVDDPDVLPDYPYRDDGLLVWRSIHEWVGAYLQTYYPSDQHVVEDRELQAWVAEVGAQDGGRIKDFGRDGRIETRDYLIQAVSHVIYTASATHAAVNFPQFNCMTYVPNWPLASFTPVGGAASQAAYLDLLPPLDVAHMQLSLGYLLGTIHYTQLGEYGHRDLILNHFPDARVHSAAAAFRERLDGVEATITDRNTRRAPYPHLLPSRIPQSVNI